MAKLRFANAASIPPWSARAPPPATGCWAAVPVYGSDHGPWYLEVAKRTYRVLLLLAVSRDHDRTWSRRPDGCVGCRFALLEVSRQNVSWQLRHFLHNADSKGLGRAAVRSICSDDGMRECGGIQELIRGERSASNHADENEQWQQPGKYSERHREDHPQPGPRKKTGTRQRGRCQACPE